MSIATSGKGKIALVTGGGTGVGKAITTALLGAGYTVVISGRRLDVLEETAKALAVETNGTVKPIAADVSDPNSVAALFEAIKSEFGRIDLLINNAGINVPNIAMDELTFEHWNAILGANLTGVFLCTQQAMKLMKTQSPRGGRIINNGSISAQAPRPNSAPYTATKHAVTGMTKSTALDGRPFDIACGQIDIGNATTEMTSKMAAGVMQANGEIASEPTIPAHHIGNAVVYMASLPLDANVLTMTIMATKMPLVGRG